MILEYRLEELGQLAQRFWRDAGNARVFAVYGPMGAGKTTTIAALCGARGVRAAVSSPTFSIINEYVYEEGGQRHPLYHMDLYRLRDLEEIIAAGVEDCLNSGAICFVEWPEKAPELLEGAMELHIEVVDDQTRRMRIGN
ncbi:tRNA (adenosine(37)-N6)-threonylcarbamoyltransferase complex ATPase subunit type 1 TsaE [Flaviaesturariibacter flavus]|uniref:tRNA threonylcarbamoyladenosine biosynthesis protein TsaE n=1 Tax=Flaviaesturariibacter flavus TaxID=2502780 RepID=A0A4R1BLG2_9BACT|nr:tRNA (adenosine(37)-N6)-threonylcarbamoyltransferase complex ATPase subunit type 1 TsaE [Flaviaesturariibacter flavus]TCJ18223.1 tRNA (adenosine(37)-N6)-threonylcarbamoyltransferase complex ATPase subunit type 1 TsaE [Flaviaesturariibacter flavus]